MGLREVQNSNPNGANNEKKNPCKQDVQVLLSQIRKKENTHIQVLMGKIHIQVLMGQIMKKEKYADKQTHTHTKIIKIIIEVEFK